MIARDGSFLKPQEFNESISHIIQSWQWGEFRKKTGVQVRRIGVFEGETLKQAFQVTFHPLPFTNFTVGYLPKSDIPDKEILEDLKEVAREEKAVFIKLEPEVDIRNIKKPKVKPFLNTKDVIKSSKTIFAPHTFLLDIAKSEEELLSSIHPKTRYNIGLAKRHGVRVEEKDDQRSFNIFLKLQRETAQRQKFFTHPDSYYQKMWETLKPHKMVHLLIANYKKKPLTAWILFRFKDTIYYPYGGSAKIHRNFMASNLIAWEAIRLGKKLGCKTFDMWGALGENPVSHDPWYGFHKFKQGYGGKLVSYIGAYDFILNPFLYNTFTLADKLRWTLLQAARTFS